MIRIIDSKRYNTETAENLGHTTHPDEDQVDSSYSTIYRTKAGNYFIHDEPSRDSSARGATECITPLTEIEAKRFMMDADLIDPLEKYFGDTITDA